MHWDASVGTSDGYDNNQIGWPVVKAICGDDQHRAFAGLLVSTDRVKVGRPDLAA